MAPRRPVVEEAHGVRRVDDYAWLRDARAAATRDHLRAERAHYRAAVEPLDPLRRRLESELLGRLPAVDASVTWERDGVVYFARTRHGDEHDVLVRFDPETGAEQLVFDPNDTGGAVRGPFVVDPDPDAAVVAYLVDPGPGDGPDPDPADGPGAPRRELRFRDVATGIDLADRVPGVAGAGAWTADGHRYVYPAADAAGRPHQVRCHTMSAPVDADALVLAEPDPAFRLEVARSRDGGWIVLTARGPGTTEVHLASRGSPTAALRCVARRRPGVEYDAEPMPGGWDGAGDDVLLVVTDDGAPEFRLVEAALPAPGTAGDPATWAPVPGSPGAGERLERALVFHEHVVLVARRDGEPFLRVIDRPPRGTDLPRRPTVRELHPGVPYGQLHLWHPEEPATRTVVMVEENLVSAPAWVAVDLSTGGRTVIKRASVPGADPTAYVTERLWATAPDGVRVPVTVARRRDARRGRTTGLVLTGHGADEVCSWPAFDVATLSLLDRGLVVAVAHVRGGGELGRHWWRAACGRDRPRAFVDYVAVRDALVAGGWAGDVRGGARVVSRGAGAGGLLQAEAFSRAPRMWRAVVAQTPLVDVVGDLLVDRPADLRDDRADGDDLALVLTWAPYDNPPPPGRASLLVTASLHDRRFPVHEAARWVARLRATDDPRTPSPLLLRVEPGTGGAAATAAGTAASGAAADGAVAPADGDGPVGRFARAAHEAEILAWILDRLDLS